MFPYLRSSLTDMASKSDHEPITLPGDIIYIYSTRPLSRIEFKCIVERTDIEFQDITDDKEFWMNTK